MYRVLAKIVLSIFLLSADFLIVYTQNVASGASSAENVIVNIKNFIKPEEIRSSLGNNNKSEKSAEYSRTARAKTFSTTKELFACAIALDASCLVDHAEVIVDNANTNLLRQADIEARKISFGRSDAKEDEEDAAPSSLISSIAKMVLEIPELIKDSISGMLRTGKLDFNGITDTSSSEDDDEDEAATKDDTNDDEEEAEEEEAEEEEANEDDEDNETEDDDGEEEDFEDNEDNEDTSVQAKDNFEQINERKKCGKKGEMCQSSGSSMGSSGSGGGGDYFGGFGGHGTAGRQVGDARGKKKKKKKKAIIKLLLLGLVLKAKITLLLKMLAAKLQIKFLLIALANVLINLARFWWDLKKGHQEQPQKVIYYEHAQHQHHYDGGEDLHQSSPGGSYWGRSYDVEEGANEKTAQDMAYTKQIPQGTTYSRINDKPNISWKSWK